MQHDSIAAVVGRLEAADPAGLTGSQARASLAALARVTNWVVATRAVLVQRLDALAGGEPPGSSGPGDGSGAGGAEAGAGEAEAEAGGAEAEAEARAKPVELELVDANRISEREAARQATLARVLARFPEFAAALRRSDVAESHLQVLGRLWQQLELADRHRLMELDARLVQLARSNDPERFRRLAASELNRRRERDGTDRLTKQRRATGLTHWVDDSGMFVVRARFDPERGQRLLSRIRHRRQAIVDAGNEPADCPTAGDLRWEHLDAIALYDLTQTGEGASSPAGEGQAMFNPPDTELIVIVDEATLRDGLHPDTRIDVHGHELPISTIRRLACDAGIIPTVLGGAGVPLDVGRVRRLATHAQRVALRVMYPTCAIPGCDMPFDYCQPHHLDPWTRRASGQPGGPTALDNLIPLCSRHHHAVHEGGWQLRLQPHTRELRVERPDGTVLVGWPDGAAPTQRTDEHRSTSPPAA